MTEYQAESTFKHYSYFYGGARHTCYTSIAAAGSSGSIFHYGHAGAANDHPLRDGDMVSFNNELWLKHGVVVMMCLLLHAMPNWSGFV